MTLLETYRKEILPVLQRRLALKNPLRVPRVEKVVVNIGTGRLHDAKDHEEVIQSLSFITGQRPLPRPAKKSIASFKIRQGQVVGYKVTLRGKRMWDFLERLINIVLPRVRDFRGILVSSIDTFGNLTLGIREHIVFPETSGHEFRHILGLEVTIVTTAKNQQEAIELFKALGFPFFEQQPRSIVRRR